MIQVEEAAMELNLINFVETAEQVACQHRWLIEPVSGPTSEGRCKHCNLTRSFHNHAEDTQRDDAPADARRLVYA
jgi:hypothetical protein